MEQVFILYICKKLINFLHSLKKKFKDNFFILLGLFLFIFFIFITTNVQAKTVDLSSYTQCNLMDGNGWCIVYSEKTEKIHLVTIGEYTGYPYLLVSCSADEKGNLYPSGEWTSMNRVGNYNGQGGTFCYTFNEDTSKFENRTNYGIGKLNLGKCSIIASGRDIYQLHGWKMFFSKTDVPDEYLIPGSYIEPYISNTDSDLANMGSNLVVIFPGSVDLDTSIRFYVSRFDEIQTDDGILHLPDEKILFDTTLNFHSSYYKSITQNGILEEFWFEVPFNDMDIKFEKDKHYKFALGYEFAEGEWHWSNRNIIMGSISETDKLNDNINKGFEDLNKGISQGFENLNQGINQSTDKIIQEEQKTQQAINEQTKAIEENNKTNKNIFEKIGEMLSYINPFSENFFVYKLIELLIEMLKGLFVPSDNFFNDWLADMNDYFSDRFGIIYYPFDLVIDFLTRVVDTCSNVSSSAVLNVPDLDFMGVTLIHAFTFDFNSLLVNDGLKTVYNIYLVVVDVILSLMLINLAKNTFAEVFGGRFTDEIISDMTRSPKTNNDKE